MDSSRAGLCPGWPRAGLDRGTRPAAGTEGLDVGRRGARKGHYADATGDGRPSPGECDTAAAGVWGSPVWAEEEDLDPEGFPGLN